MEWLIVICVGLDSAKQAAGNAASDIEFAETRSKLYRGVTRAHMMVLAVNEYISDGWLAFLTTVRLRDDTKFDSKKTLEAAERDRKLSAQFEHSLGVTEDGFEVFTRSLAGLEKPPYNLDKAAE